LALLLSTALVAAVTVVGGTPPPAGAQPLTSQPFNAYSTGTTVSVNALGLGTTQIAGVHAAFAGASVNSQGLNSTINDEFGQAVQPALAGKNSYGRGTGLETGITTPIPQPTDLNQLLLTGLAQASAAPSTGLVTKSIALNLAPIATATLLQGQAQAIWDPNFCVIGKPFGFGDGQAANLTLVGTPPATLVGTTVNGNNVSESKSFTFLVANGDGTFGVASETVQHVAPISLLNTALGPSVTVEVSGAFGLLAVATGKPGDPRNGVTTLGNPILTVRGAGGVPILGPIQLINLLGPGGLTVNAAPLVSLSLGQKPRAIGGAPGSAPAVAANGTAAAGALDVVARIGLLTLPGLSVLDAGIGHMESLATAPPGGLKCEIPVKKTAEPDPVQAGQDVTIRVIIPSDAGLAAQLLGCDLIGIKASSTESVLNGNPRFRIVSASNGGTISGNTVTWANLGNYHPGDPPIVASYVIRIDPRSGGGTLQDVANVSASLGNCTGGAAGQDLVGSARLQNAAATGTFTLRGPTVGTGAGHLAATGADLPYLLLGGLLLLAALETRRRVRKARAPATADRSTQ
jgi:hypothetical protein